MRYTLLEIVQLLLSSMDSDEVTSITDSVESNDIALLCKSVYYDMATELGLPEHDGIFELDETGASTPVLMTVPTNVVRIDRILYNNKTSTDTYSNYIECNYKTWDNFLEFTTPLKDQTSDVAEMSFTHNSETFDAGDYTVVAIR